MLFKSILREVSAVHQTYNIQNYTRKIAYFATSDNPVCSIFKGWNVIHGKRNQRISLAAISWTRILYTTIVLSSVAGSQLLDYSNSWETNLDCYGIGPTTEILLQMAWPLQSIHVATSVNPKLNILLLIKHTYVDVTSHIYKLIFPFD